MRKAFRDAYNRELGILKERTSEFAADYPGLADRLGGLLEENLDPAVAGLLEGSAFLAARVQLNMEEEFRTFTDELLEQVFPDALSPIPSAMLVQGAPPYGNSDIVKGVRFERGDYLDARFTDADKRVSCRFQLTAPLVLWPLKLSKATYHSRSGPIGALGQDIAKGTKAGLELEIKRVNSSGKTTKAGPLNEVEIDELPIYLTGPLAEAVPLYEQIHCDNLRASIRYLNKQGDPVFVRLAPDAIKQVGFDSEERLFPHDGRLFDGYATLREAFVFSRKFLGFNVTGLKQALHGIEADTVQLIIEFSNVNPVLSTRFELEHLQLHTVPAVNLFEEHASQVRIDKKRHEFIVTPDSSPITHYEIHSISEVFAHFSGDQAKVRMFPLYALPDDDQDPRHASYYTFNRKPRRLTDRERHFGGARHRYRGTETFISIYQPPEAETAQRLQIKTMCSNRHLTEYLPIAQGTDDFYMCEDQTVTLNCVAGPSLPREPLAELEAQAAHHTTAGDNYWKIISYLSLNQYGLENRDGGEGAASLREMLSLFADLSDNITEAQVQGLKTVETRPIVRTIKRADGFHPARGLEIHLTFDEDEYEGSGIILLGAVLDRFLSEYAAVNSFTQTVISTIQRGKITAWPPRSGNGPLI